MEKRLQPRETAEVPRPQYDNFGNAVSYMNFFRKSGFLSEEQEGSETFKNSPFLRRFRDFLSQEVNRELASSESLQDDYTDLSLNATHEADQSLLVPSNITAEIETNSSTSVDTQTTTDSTSEHLEPEDIIKREATQNSSKNVSTPVDAQIAADSTSDFLSTQDYIGEVLQGNKSTRVPTAHATVPTVDSTFDFFSLDDFGGKKMKQTRPTSVLMDSTIETAADSTTDSREVKKPKDMNASWNQSSEVSSSIDALTGTDSLKESPQSQTLENTNVQGNQSRSSSTPVDMQLAADSSTNLQLLQKSVEKNGLQNRSSSVSDQTDVQMAADSSAGVFMRQAVQRNQSPSVPSLMDAQAAAGSNSEYRKLQKAIERETARIHANAKHSGKLAFGEKLDRPSKKPADLDLEYPSSDDDYPDVKDIPSHTDVPSYEVIQKTYDENGYFTPNPNRPTSSFGIEKYHIPKTQGNYPLTGSESHNSYDYPSFKQQMYNTHPYAPTTRSKHGAPQVNEETDEAPDYGDPSDFIGIGQYPTDYVIHSAEEPEADYYDNDKPSEEYYPYFAPQKKKKPADEDDYDFGDDEDEEGEKKEKDEYYDEGDEEPDADYTNIQPTVKALDPETKASSSFSTKVKPKKEKKAAKKAMKKFLKAAPVLLPVLPALALLKPTNAIKRCTLKNKTVDEPAKNGSANVTRKECYLCFNTMNGEKTEQCINKTQSKPEEVRQVEKSGDAKVRVARQIIVRRWVPELEVYPREARRRAPRRDEVDSVDFDFEHAGEDLENDDLDFFPDDDEEHSSDVDEYLPPPESLREMEDGACKKVRKNGLNCLVCEKPNSAGTFEQCSYESDPKENAYEYSTKETYGSRNKPYSDRYRRSKKPRDKKDTYPKKRTVHEMTDAEEESAKPADGSWDGPADERNRRQKHRRAKKDTHQGSSVNPLEDKAEHNRVKKDINLGKSPFDSGILPKGASIGRGKIDLLGRNNGFNSDLGKSYSLSGSSDDGFSSGVFQGVSGLGGKSNHFSDGFSSDLDSVIKPDSGLLPKFGSQSSLGSGGGLFKKERPSLFDDRPQLRLKPEKNSYDSLLGDFTGKDRSHCKKEIKDGATCYYCTDDEGSEHEECMYVKKSKPENKEVKFHQSKEVKTPLRGHKAANKFDEILNSNTANKPVYRKNDWKIQPPPTTFEDFEEDVESTYAEHQASSPGYQSPYRSGSSATSTVSRTDFKNDENPTGYRYNTQHSPLASKEGELNPTEKPDRRYGSYGMTNYPTKPSSPEEDDDELEEADENGDSEPLGENSSNNLRHHEARSDDDVRLVYDDQFQMTLPKFMVEKTEQEEEFDSTYKSSLRNIEKT